MRLKKAVTLHIVLLLCLLVLATPPAGALDDADMAELVETGGRLLASGAYEEAIEAFSAAIEAGHENVDAHLGLGEANYLSGKYDKAAEVLECLAATDSGNPRATVLLSRVFRATGRHVDAEKLLISFDGREENYPAVLAELADYYAENGYRTKAREAARRAIEPLRGNTKLTADELCVAARCLEHLGRLKEAMKAYDDGLALGVDNFELLRRSARFMHGTLSPDFTKARERFYQAKRINKRHPELLAAYAAYEATRNRFDEAFELLKAALEVDPASAHALLTRGGIYLSQQRYAEAQKDLEKIRDTNPGYYPALIALAASYRLPGKDDEFEIIKSEIFAINDKPTDFYYTIGQMFSRVIMPREAETWLRKAVEEDPEFAPAQHALGTTLLHLGRLEEARTVLKAAQKLDSFNAWTRNILELLDFIHSDYATVETEHATIRLHVEEEPLVGELYGYLAEKAYRCLSERYGFEPSYPVYIEAYDSQEDFSVATLGMTGIPAAGVCFGPRMAFDTARIGARPGGTAAGFSWANVFWHELAHVVTLQKSENRIPRWLTEGCSVHGECDLFPRGNRNMEMQLLNMYYREGLPRIEEFNSWYFSRRVLTAYYLGRWFVRMMIDRRGVEKLRDFITAFGERKSLVEALDEVYGTTPAEYDADFREYIGEYAARFRIDRPASVETAGRLKAALGDNPAARRLAETAWAYYSAGKAVDSEMFTAAALKADRDDALAHYTLGRLYLSKGARDKAEDEILRAFVLGYDSYEMRLYLAGLAARPADGEKAPPPGPVRVDAPETIEHLEKALEYFPYDPRTAVRVATYYKSKGEQGKWAEYIEIALLLDDTSLSARLELAAYYMGAPGGRGRARELYTEYVWTYPYNPFPLRELARMHLEDREYEASRVFAYTAIGVSGRKPAEADYIVLLTSLIELGDIKEAWHRAVEAVEKFPDSKELNSLKTRIEEAMTADK